MSKELTVTAPGGPVASIVPHNLTEVQTLAAMIAKANWCPKSYLTDNKPDEAKISLGIMQGLEVGLKPVQALQSIAVVNGIPSLYGDGALAVVYAAGVIEDFVEEPIMGDWKSEKGTVTGYRCALKRKGRPTPTVREFTLEMADKASLLGKAGPWQQYRARMLQMRARAWALRDSCADVLKGLAIFEEVQDVEVRDVTPRAEPPKSAAGKLDAFAGGSGQAFQDGRDHPPTKETPHDPVTGEVQDADFTDPDDAPEEVMEAFREEGKGVPFMNWFAGRITDKPDTERQAFGDRHMDALLAIAARSDRNKAAVDNLAATKGFKLKEVTDGQ